jgi:DNA-binding NtrC family response regulator
LEQQERTIIENAIQACGGNKAVAARRLGISEKTIYNKFKRFRAENQA